LDRDVTHRVKLVWLPLKKQVLAVSTLNYSEVLILMLEIWATTYEMPGLSTIVAQTGWKVSVVWTSLGPLPRWVPGPTTRWAPGTTRLALHGT
jgi:hypothetical protein